VGNGEDFEIVFVSSDKNESSFQDYFGEMPWLALPFADRDAKAQLSKKFKVSGIPALIILDEAGELINKEGRSVVMRDPSEWKPPTLWEALSGDLIAKSEIGKATVDEVRAQSDVIALYFSAHWCPPCRGFTPELSATYEKVVAAGKRLSVVFCSSDRSESQFKEYFDEMPGGWYGIDGDDKRKEQLSTLFEVQGIPSLVVIDAKTGETINGDARGFVGSDPDGASFPWRPPAVADLSSPDGINETPSLCIMAEGCTAEQREAMMAWFTPIAKEAISKEEEAMVFFMANTSEGATPQVRKLTKLGDAKPEPQLLLLDIPDNGGYYTCGAAEITEATVADFLNAFKAGTLERKQLDK